jgi:hypothetical protein
MIESCEPKFHNAPSSNQVSGNNVVHSWRRVRRTEEVTRAGDDHNGDGS